jgi:hypothetical protein
MLTHSPVRRGRGGCASSTGSGAGAICWPAYGEGVSHAGDGISAKLGADSGGTVVHGCPETGCAETGCAETGCAEIGCAEIGWGVVAHGDTGASPDRRPGASGQLDGPGAAALLSTAA